MMTVGLSLLCALVGGLLTLRGVSREKQPADELLRRYGQELADSRRGG